MKPFQPGKKEADVAKTSTKGDYAAARLDMDDGDVEKQEAGDGKDWQYADATRDIENNNGPAVDEMPSRPGTPSESVAAALNRRK